MVSDTTASHLVQLPDPEDIEDVRQRLAGRGEYAETETVSGAAWFVMLAWFLTVPKPGGDAPG